jgi:hypothetical protein
MVSAWAWPTIRLRFKLAVHFTAPKLLSLSDYFHDIPKDMHEITSEKYVFPVQLETSA